jgi:hypothetical protein
MNLREKEDGVVCCLKASYWRNNMKMNVGTKILIKKIFSKKNKNKNIVCEKEAECFDFFDFQRLNIL